MHENGTVLVLKPRGGTTRDSQEESKVMVIMPLIGSALPDCMQHCGWRCRPGCMERYSEE